MPKTPEPARPPVPVVLEGRYVRLEPLSASHAADLFAASEGQGERFRYLPNDPPQSLGEMQGWIETAIARPDLYFAVIDKATGRALGRQCLMRITPEHGVIEIGNIYWGPGMARSRLATEAQFLFARHVFDDLGYRRYEWKCNARNEPSRRAALRFGFTFEGTFRQHMIVKGESRDTDWFAILDTDWPRLKAGYETWLDPANFDAAGQQRAALEF